MNGAPSVPRTGVWMFPDKPAGELVEVIAHAEAMAIDELWLGDEGPARDPLAVIAAAAVATHEIVLATGITNPYVRHPVITTTSMLTVHELSGGRCILGVGAGGHMSLAPMGLTARRPVSALSDFVAQARAVTAGVAAAGYSPPDYALTAAVAGRPLPIYVGARGERLNRLASEVADGAFVAGLPPFRYDEVIGWARSVRPIDISIYPSVAFTDRDIDHHRPEMIWSLHDTPPAVRDELGLDIERVRAAAEALRSGDPDPARRVLDDDLLEKVMLLGDPEAVGGRLAELVTNHRPVSVGLALIQDDLLAGVEACARAFTAMRTALDRTAEEAT